MHMQKKINVKYINHINGTKPREYDLKKDPYQIMIWLDENTHSQMMNEIDNKFRKTKIPNEDYYWYAYGSRRLLRFSMRRINFISQIIMFLALYSLYFNSIIIYRVYKNEER